MWWCMEAADSSPHFPDLDLVDLDLVETPSRLKQAVADLPSRPLVDLDLLACQHYCCARRRNTRWLLSYHRTRGCLVLPSQALQVHHPLLAEKLCCQSWMGVARRMLTCQRNLCYRTALLELMLLLPLSLMRLYCWEPVAAFQQCCKHTQAILYTKLTHNV